VDFTIEGVEFQTERCFEPRKGRGASPSLRRTGDRIERWTVAPLSLEAAECASPRATVRMPQPEKKFGRNSSSHGFFAPSSASA
jgi:hypothetical protein